MDRSAITTRFAGTQEFLAQETYLAQGCFFVPVADPLPEPFAELTLHLQTPEGARVELRARVVQISPGHRMALAPLDPAAARAQMAPVFQKERAAAAREGKTTTAWGAPASGEGAEPAAEGPIHERIRTMSTADKQQLALQGDRVARLALVKDDNKTLQAFLLKNPRITLEEVRYIASYRQASPDALVTIANHKEWGQSPGVVAALVRNPKTPTPTAVKLLDRLPMSDVRLLAKANDAPHAVVQAARKKGT